MNLVFGSPGRYVQGPQLLDQAGPYLAHCGGQALVVIDSFVRGIIGDRLKATCAEVGVEVQFLTFDGEITAAGINALKEEAARCSFDHIVAAGGGKCIDAGKALAHAFDCPLVTAPTVASNDAPTSKNFVIYDANHQLAEVGHLVCSPRYVLVDTALIASAPKQFLVAGIADALTKKFEAEQCLKADGLNMFRARSSLAAVALARECYEVIRRDALPALLQAGTGVATPAFERLIEAVLLMSGLGFESGGLSIAHAMTRGLSRVNGAREQVHGHQVAYGLLVQLVLEGRDAAFMADLLDFYAQLGLPRRLADLDVPVPDEATLRAIAGPTLAAPHARNFTPAPDEDALVAAMRRLESLS